MDELANGRRQPKEGGEQNKSFCDTLEIHANDDEAEQDGHKASIRSEVAHIEGPEEWAGTLNKKAFEAGIVLTQLAPQLPNLEETFFEMTGDRS